MKKIYILLCFAFVMCAGNAAAECKNGVCSSCSSHACKDALVNPGEKKRELFGAERTGQYELDNGKNSVTIKV